MRTLFGLGLSAAVLLTGCSTTSQVTNSEQPGPAIGQAVGTAAGAVAGNAAGLVVGVGEGAAGGAAAVFDPTTRVVRQWHEEKTPDGRTINVPEDYLVDRNGRVIRKVKTAQ